MNLFVVIHSHRFGTSVETVFTEAPALDEEQAIKLADLDYEPDREESVEVVGPIDPPHDPKLLTAAMQVADRFDAMEPHGYSPDDKFVTVTAKQFKACQNAVLHLREIFEL